MNQNQKQDAEIRLAESQEEVRESTGREEIVILEIVPPALPFGRSSLPGSENVRDCGLVPFH